MNVVEVMDEIGDALEAIPGLHVWPYPVDQVSPPAAIVQFPTVNYDQAFQRGLDRWDGGIVVLVSRVWDKAARDNLSKYVDGSGSTSVHAALKDRDWTTCAYARVTRCTFPPGYTIGTTPFVAAQFELDIAGTG